MDRFRRSLLEDDADQFSKTLVSMTNVLSQAELETCIGMAEFIDGELFDVGWLENLPYSRRVVVALWMMDEILKLDVPSSFRLEHVDLKCQSLDTRFFKHLSFSSFRTLSDLKTVNLARNQLASIPHFFSNIHSLVELDLHDNCLNDLTGQLKSLTGLRELYVDDNKLCDLPCELGDLHDLEVLDAQRNAIAALPESLSTLMHLKWLNLSHNRIEEIPSFMSNLQSLTYFDIRDNPLSSTLPKLHSVRLDARQWSDLDRLKLEDVSHLNLSFIDLETLTFQALTGNSLRSLNIAGSPICSIPDEIGRFTKLKHLDLRMTRINKLCKGFDQLSSLETVLIEEEQGDLALLIRNCLPRVKIKVWNE